MPLYKPVAQIVASIGAFGWTNPILVGPDYVVIAGHAQLAAAKKLGMTEVPVIVLGHLTEAQPGSGVFEEIAHARDLVSRQVTHHHDIARRTRTSIHAASPVGPTPSAAVLPREYVEGRRKGMRQGRLPR